jgi:hypothetical protein
MSSQTTPFADALGAKKCGLRTRLKVAAFAHSRHVNFLQNKNASLQKNVLRRSIFDFAAKTLLIDALGGALCFRLDRRLSGK